MVELSRGFRNGRIVSISPKQYLVQNQKNTPFVQVRIYSEFEIGMGERRAEYSNILLIGDSVMEKWDKATGAGDVLRLFYATQYVNNGELCFRVTDPDNFEVTEEKSVPNQNAVSTKPDYEEVDAADFFRALVKERQGKTQV